MLMSVASALACATLVPRSCAHDGAAQPRAGVARVQPAPDGHLFAIVRVIQRIEECSNAGGEHYVLELADGTGRLAHVGGHAVRIGLIDNAFGIHLQPSDPTKAPGRFIVAELTMNPPTDPDADGNPDSSRDGWCLSGLPKFAASAVRLLPARDLADAKRLLDRVQRLGMPPKPTDLAPDRPPSPRDDIAIARITAVGTEGTRVMLAQLEAVEGDPPARIPVSPFRSPHPGDFVVIASSGKLTTRYLLPNDLASARRWAADIRRDGWPIVPISLGYLDLQ